MINPEQLDKDPRVVRQFVIDGAISLLERACMQYESVAIPPAQVQITAEPEPEIYVNAIEQARRQVDSQFAVPSFDVQPPVVPVDTVFNDNITSQVNLENLSIAANKKVK